MRAACCVLRATVNKVCISFNTFHIHVKVYMLLPEMRTAIHDATHPQVHTICVYPSSVSGPEHEDAPVDEGQYRVLTQPHLEPQGLSVLTERLTKAMTYLEYGSGGSTVLAASVGVPTIFSVESSPTWFAEISDQLHLLSSRSKSTSLLMLVSLGLVGSWGYPDDCTHIAAWPQYVSHIWECLHISVRPDLIFIDGRFRIACFLYSLLQSAPDTTILFDDWTDERYTQAREALSFIKAWPSDLLAPQALYGRLAEFKVPRLSDMQRNAVLSLFMNHMFLVD